MSQRDNLAGIINSCTFYRIVFRKTTWVVLFLVLIALGQSGYIMYNTFNPKPPQFIICTSDGRLIPLATLKKQ